MNYKLWTTVYKATDKSSYVIIKLNKRSATISNNGFKEIISLDDLWLHFN